MRTAASVPVTHASCPGSIATTCGATISNAQPSRYRPCTRPRARKPTCACMQYSVPTMGLMCVDQRKPGGRRPASPGRWQRAHDVELDARDHAVLCASDGRRQRVPRPTQRPAARGRCRTRPGRSPRALHPRLPGLTSADRRHAPAQDPGEQLGVEAGPDQLDALVEALAVRADPGALELEDADAPAGGSTISALAVMAASESATANRPLRETTGHAITSRRSYLPGVTRSRARDAGW